MKKLVSMLIFCLLLMGTMTANAMTVNYHSPVLEKYELSLAKHVYHLRIPADEQSGNYTGPWWCTINVVGEWANGKATETTTAIDNVGQTRFKMIKTADCPQDPWMTENPVYNNLQKNTPYLQQNFWEFASPLASFNGFKSAELFSPAKAQLRAELAKCPPILRSPADGMKFTALSAVKITYQKHPEHPVKLYYEYREPGKDFESAFPPNTANTVSMGDTFSTDVAFFLIGDWRVQAKSDVTGAAPSVWLNLTIKPRPPALSKPAIGATYTMPLLGAIKAVTVPIKAEHNYRETVSFVVNYRATPTSAWSMADSSSVIIQYVPNTYVTEGTLKISQAGEYRVQVWSPLAQAGSEWRQFKVNKLPGKAFQ